MPFLATLGVGAIGAYRAFRGGAAAERIYIEDVFSTYLYTGNGSAQTINNGIALGGDYGGSVYFDGTGDYLSIASGSCMTMGTDDFTAECWINPNTVSSTYQMILDNAWDAATYSWQFGLTTNTVSVWNANGASATLTFSSSGTVSASVWTHIAIVKSGTTVTIYINGVASGSSTMNTTFGRDSISYIGGENGTNLPFNGYISNLRVVKGTALYTSNFTPSTTPLTAISGTSLLTCQSPSPTTDYSSNAFTITVTNAVAQNGGGPFADSTVTSNGGLVWIKSRSGGTAAYPHEVFDTYRGATYRLAFNSTAASSPSATTLTSFNSNGFSLRSNQEVNENGSTYCSWTFRKQAKFFDVVSWTGDTVFGRAISHNLGSIPGMIIAKRTNASGSPDSDWYVYHRSLGANKYLRMNFTTEALTYSGVWSGTEPTSTQFYVGSDTLINASGNSYIAYLFAHDAGGFGPTGTDNVITCGSYIGNGSATGPTVTLGYEPQWLLIKKSSTGTENWVLIDNMRGFLVDGNDARLYPNDTTVESLTATRISPTATGFQINSTDDQVNTNGGTYIYIAIRRGPMKTPTSGTEVFKPITRTGTAGAGSITDVGFPPDLLVGSPRNFNYSYFISKILGAQKFLIGTSSSSETSTSAGEDFTSFNQDGFSFGTPVQTAWNNNATASVMWNFRRFPGFLDTVCYKGDGNSGGQTISHNLQVAPELIFLKGRNDSLNRWRVFHKDQTAGKSLFLNDDTSESTETARISTVSSTTFTLSNGGGGVNGSGTNYVAYLFASVAGVSKVGSYTGTGTTLTIDCGFTAGARFVLIKRKDDIGDWYVWDTARGIVTGNDPYLLMNRTNAEVTNTDYIDPVNSGFEISSTAPAAINADGGSYIFLAIA